MGNCAVTAPGSREAQEWTPGEAQDVGARAPAARSTKDRVAGVVAVYPATVPATVARGLARDGRNQSFDR